MYINTYIMLPVSYYFRNSINLDFTNHWTVGYFLVIRDAYSKNKDKIIT